jgi:demethylspheroidene O-methyltransferase
MRDALLADPGFQRWAARFPLTRPIARRRAAQLFDLCGGFIYSQILLACVRLDLFEKLAGGPQTLAELAPRLALDESQAHRLLEAAVALKLVQRRSRGRYGLGPHGAALRGNGGVAEMIEHHAMLYRDLIDPLALLRGEPNGVPGGETELQRFWGYARNAEPGAVPPEGVAGYSELMSASQAMIAEEVIEAYPLGRHRRLLDLGGGQGTFLMEVARRVPNLELRLFDLPAVAARARANFESAGLSGRAEAAGGDFTRDPLPEGADAVSLVRIVHDHDDARAMEILRAARRALPQGGTLLLAEPMAGTPGAEPSGAAYFGFYLLAMGSGRPRTAGELGHMLARAGFDEVRERPTRRPMLTRLIVARAAGGGAAARRTDAGDPPQS